MHRRFGIAAALVAAAFLSPPCQMNAAAQDVAAGKRKAVACQTCHGLDGIAKLPDAPNLAAQPAAYLEREMRAYRSGTRRNEVMSFAAKPLSDDDIRNLAAYYSAIQIEVKSVPQ
ncbi:MAG TPA: cytochrome c [Burkholderiaceae bacterium]|nr:cytochrome c [Burkholderiaceae bacterium]HQR70898.1 cytochrome c [Burkholderiaceae bacterium]